MITFDTHKGKIAPLDQKARLKLVFEWVKTGHLNTTEFIKFIEFCAASLPAPTGDGSWHPWFGGECPVEPTTLVIYQMRDCDIEVQPRPAGELDWAHNTDQGAEWEITAYMIVQGKTK